MNTTLRLIGIVGVSLFGLLFLVTFTSPEKIEESAKVFVKIQIEREVREKQQTIANSTAAEAALIIAGKLGLEKERIQSSLDDNLPEKIASILVSMCGYDCEKKKLLAQSISTTYLERIKNIQIAERTLSDLVRDKYVEIVGHLKQDLRVFLGSNLAMFLILVMVSFFNPQAMKHLFLPGLLLVFATVISSGIYIFGQDWFYTILYNDYMGFGYLFYIGLIFGFLLDIALNKGRIVTEIINSIANAIGSSISLTPC